MAQPHTSNHKIRTPHTSNNKNIFAFGTELGCQTLTTKSEFRNCEKSWGVTGATEAEVACFKTHGWCVAIYAAHLLSLIKVRCLTALSSV